MQHGTKGTLDNLLWEAYKAGRRDEANCHKGVFNVPWWHRAKRDFFNWRKNLPNTLNPPPLKDRNAR